MESVTNILVVEDELEWCGIYERIAAQGMKTLVRTAPSLASATRAVEETKFAVAFVDVGLDALDARNIDGVRVMRRMREIGDETSIVVITGRAGHDVVNITRDAIKEYNAFGTLSKANVTPSVLKEVLRAGVAEYRSVVPSPRSTIREAFGVLGGSSLVWNERAMRTTGFQGDQSAFDNYLAELFGDYLPLVARRDCAHLTMQAAPGLVYGAYWSRLTTCAAYRERSELCQRSWTFSRLLIMQRLLRPGSRCMSPSAGCQTLQR